MKLLITGLNGFVAGSIVAHARKDGDVYGVDLTKPEGLPADIQAFQMDLLDKDKLAGLYTDIKPDAVIHTAAIANIDVCETNREIAWKINVGITEQLADLCRETATKMILCSTDSVFDGIKGFYTENDTPAAVNFYASTKVEAEKIVLSASPDNVVARLALVMGLPVMGKGNSFLADTIAKLTNGETVKFPENEIRTPVDVVTLGAALTELAGSNFGGIVHLSGNTRINRYQMAIRIAEKLGFQPGLIVPTDSNSMPGRAPRPNDASMDNSLARKILKTPMRTLEEGLELILNFNRKNESI
jgi:dTDP-4-dehydrorhamnose reductase